MALQFHFLELVLQIYVLLGYDMDMVIYSSISFIVNV